MNLYLSLYIVALFASFLFGYEVKSSIVQKEDTEQNLVLANDQIKKYSQVDSVVFELSKIRQNYENTQNEQLALLDKIRKDVSLQCRNSPDGLRIINETVKSANQRKLANSMRNN